ncbi:hypothetical protein ABGN05_23075 [Aquibium sp. LZ166]|uniref:HEPN domain-containing protein n=1 Tax=Aquibium pacificus TaxID=3153579 RepID=A0ABV3SP23_9HYPH
MDKTFYQIVNNAESFFDAAAPRASAEDTSDDGKAVVIYLIPAVVCLALSAELFLRAIIRSETLQNACGHKLSSLYSELKAQTREIISQIYSKESNGSREDLQKILNSNDDTFIKYKYYFESGVSEEANYQDLHYLCIALRKYIKNYLVDVPLSAVDTI